MTVHAAVMNTSASTDCKDDGGISEVSEDSDTSQDAVATSAGMGQNWEPAHARSCKQSALSLRGAFGIQQPYNDLSFIPRNTQFKTRMRVDR